MLKVHEAFTKSSSTIKTNRLKVIFCYYLFWENISLRGTWKGSMHLELHKKVEVHGGGKATGRIYEPLAVLGRKRSRRKCLFLGFSSVFVFSAFPFFTVLPSSEKHFFGGISEGAKHRFRGWTLGPLFLKGLLKGGNDLFLVPLLFWFLFLFFGYVFLFWFLFFGFLQQNQ